MSAAIPGGRYSSLFELASIFGVSLNGEVAKLDLAPKSGLAEVKTASGKRSVFTWSVAELVMKRKKGAFKTQDVLDGRPDVKAICRAWGEGRIS